ncbi:peptide synthetase [Streptomyces alboflavus]|uniref:Peptide synthetase n=1 Tax=Streptomyces alboflavus TaxID=67267 RepID=A0A1Z1WSP9_9ACTN|nr:peptide synthetase [Streptomyces alboflavus]
MDRAANRLAHRLIGQGVGPERIVALALPRARESVIAQLAVTKAGAAFLPVDPYTRNYGVSSWSATRARHSSWTTRGRVGPGGPRHSAHGCRPHRRPDARPPAYVIYTSGSTGTPKGVIVPHHGLAGFAAAAAAQYAVGPGDRVLQFASPASTPPSSNCAPRSSAERRW